MRHQLPTPLELAESPELATLHAVQVALEVVQRSLLAAYPDLEQADFLLDSPVLTPEEYLADTVIGAALALDAVINRYRHYITVRRRAIYDTRPQLKDF